MTYAFTFDASACSGCKACQAACKDKNGLPPGVLWRRVYEVNGGDWERQGEAWTNSVFAYNLSIACNHCVHPKCAGVCPTDAYVVRPDGIVYIDTSKCVGCGYCGWACPYSAPRYNPTAGTMTKCNFCYDDLDAGKPPACVAACPLRVLDCVTVEEGLRTEDEGPRTEDERSRTETGWKALWEIPGTEHPFPLPAFSRTQPHLLLRPHPAMANALEKRIANQEEIQPSARVRRAGLNDAVPRPGKNRLIGFLSTGWRDAQLTLRELPLMLFTLLAQMAAGLTVTSLVFGPSSLILLIIGALLGLGLLNSLLHLGTPLNAWRTLNHLGKSWLSREILMAGLFGASWLTLTGVHWLLITEYWLLLTLHALTALLGLGLVYAMAQVYRIKAVPAWNTWRTEAAFLLSAGTLGLAGIAFWTSRAAGWISLSLLLAAEAAALLSDPNPLQPTVRRFRVGLILLALAGALTMPFVPEQAGAWLKLPIFLLILVEECAGRWRFYQHLEERCL